MRKAVYPGTFDPITLGHLDVIKRGSNLFDELVVAVTTNPNKKTLFSLEERIELIEKSVSGMKNISVKGFNSLLVDFMKNENSTIVLRGLREVSDFSSEFQHAIVNRKLGENIETVFVMTSENYFYLNSSLVKEIASFKGDVSEFVPEPVGEKLKGKFK
ncbi:MAG: pantetheine-phosphate adenylyltransferase [Candidatus Diapherotrites archaeon]